MKRIGLSAWGIAGLAAAFGLSACAAPLERGYVTGPQLPPRAQPASSAYAWLDRADALLDAIADAPPDYSFDHRGRRLFAWDVDGVLIVEEPGQDGYVLYVFERGQSLPFFVRTPDFAAAFDRGELAIIDTPGGRSQLAAYISSDSAEAYALRERGGAIREAARRSRWDRDSARAWAGVQTFVIETRDAWDEHWRADRDLADYRRRIEAEAARAALQDERRRRREARDEFRRWRDGGFAGAPPPGARRPDRPDRPRDRDDRPERPRDRDDRPGRPDRPGDTPSPPATVTPPERPASRPPRPPVGDRPVELPAPPIVPETEPDYDRVAPDRLTRPRPPRIEDAPPPSSGRGLIPISDLFRDEEERRRTEAAELERVTREQEVALQAMREAQAEEVRRVEARRADEAAERQAQAVEAVERSGRQAEAEEAQRRAAEQAEQNDARRRAAEQAQAADAESRAAQQAAADEAARLEREAQSEARARAEAEARRRAAEQTAVEEARRAEQEEADARARAEQRRREMEPTLQPH